MYIGRARRRSKLFIWLGKDSNLTCRYPPCYKDVSFWLPTDDSFTENNLCEQVRNIAGDLVEEVKLIDNFTHPKKVHPHCKVCLPLEQACVTSA